MYVCVLGCCNVGREHVVVVRSPAAGHQPHTYTPRPLAQEARNRAWSTAAVVPLLAVLLNADFVAARLSSCLSKKKKTPVVV